MQRANGQTNMQMITDESVGNALNWSKVVAAIEAGHQLPKALISDQFVNRTPDTLLSRAAWIDGLGFGVKSVSVFPENAGKDMPTIHGAMLVFEDVHGQLEAIIDSGLITNWKTAADSVLGAKLLARPDSESLLIIGAGSVAAKLVDAYREVLPNLTKIKIWNRTRQRAQDLAKACSQRGIAVEVAEDLEVACGRADVISCATMSTQPMLMGKWVKPGTHVDLIGAFKADMREADDALLLKARLFVDSFDTTLHHIGELKIPLEAGVISQEDVLADLYQLVGAQAKRETANDITVFKNGGGAHLDLMTARCIIDCITP
ncbi:ornithine cyclodeaminase family protein [Pseudahrensia aquimaris]|uniref:Ornithine cyclodeaminase family protein n=1 Tax=Pseudahrensia aquimaris TaxID=744461 RepID=A0ABW3FH10_9HYPH